MSNNSCILSNNFVDFDLRPLQKPDGHNYRVQDKKYTYYINVCKSTSIPNCAPSGYSASVCQEIADTNQVYSLGVYNQQKLSYIDGQLVLKYMGGKACSSGFKRESFITFKCNPTIGQGAPVFAGELSYCAYFFEWETKYACPPSRRTGSACRATRNGTNYDLTELIRSNGTDWLVIDGENSNSTRIIYINVCGRLNRQAATSKCNINSAACLIDKKDGTVKDLGHYLTAPVLNPDNSLTLNYTGGEQCINGVLRRTVVTFVCSHGDLTSPPVLVSHSADDCTYTIMWKTAVACPLGLNQGDNCKVEDKSAGYVFDLNGMQGNVLGHNYTTTRHDKYTYYLRICRNISDSSIKDCTNSGACQGDPSSKDHKYRKIGVANSKLFYYDGILKLMYSNGEACHNGQKRQTHIAFICSPHSPMQGAGRPEFVHEDHCIYHFRWPTKFACPAQVVECAVRSNNLQYDLSSLAKTDDNWTFQNGKGTFYINVCRSLNLNSAVRQCFGTSAVCLESNGNYINLGEVDSSLKATSQGTISITYTNGDPCQADKNKRYQSEITFICKKGVVGKGPQLESSGNNGCLYKFRWESAAACAITNTIGANCSVQDPKSATIFNMFALSRQPSKPYTISTPSGRTFTLNICDKIDKTLCNKDSGVDIGVCMKETDKKLLNLGVVSQKLEFEGETLVLTYRDGDRDVNNGFPRISKIRFYCDPNTTLGSPKYIEQASEKDGEVFYFDFKTSLACSMNQVQCQFNSSNGQSYDLTPMGLIAGNWEAVDTRSSHKHLHYYINVCRAINPVTSSIQCPFTSVGAVQIDHSTSKCYNLGYIQSNPEIVSEGLITLHYYGGTRCHNKYARSTRVNLHCADFTGPPIFETETSECEYVFNWQTPSACALTREAGDNCQVTDRQYDYKYSLSSLVGSFSFKVPGGTVYLGVCAKAAPCKDENTAACFIKENKDIVKLGDVSKQLTFFGQEIFLRYSNLKCSLLVRFECDQNAHGGGNGPKLERVDDKKCEYYSRWATDLACRPNTHVQCSIRTASSDKKTDLQYDFTRLTKHNDNWKATTSTTSSASFFINVCRPVIRTGEASICSQTAGVCKVETTKSGTKRATSLGQLTSIPVVKGNSIYLNYSRGDKCSNGKLASATIRMECGPSAEAAPMEVNVYQDTCTYEFLWITKYACPINTMNQTITNDCTAVNPITNYKFDLNQLANDTDYRVDDNKGHYFYLNVCQGLKKATKCGKDSGSCQYKLDGSAAYNAGKASMQLTYQDGVLKLTYSGGQVCHHSKTSRTTVISFVCSWTSSNELGKPVFVDESDDCTYYFSWHTKLACERKVECSPVIQNKNSNSKYGIRKLAKDDHNWLVLPSDGAVHTSTYFINICKALVPMKGINCPAGASACEETKSGTFLSLGRAADPPKVDGNKIIVTYINGTNNAQTRIELTCAHGSLGKPLFAYKNKNLYTFTWSTSAACVNQEVVDLPRCRVYDNGTGFYYDISSLRTANNNGYVALAAPDGGTVYASVCRGLPVKKCTGAGVCLARSTGNNQALGLFQYMTMTYIYEENMLMIKYCDRQCHSDQVKYTSRIMFICDETVTTSNTGYSLESIDSHGANIIWRTSLVCSPAQEECVFKDQDHLYDLQLLSSKKKSWHYTTSTGDKYWLNLCRGINDQTGCPRSATVCAQLGSNKNMLVLGYGKTQTISKSTPTDKQILVHYTGQSNIPVCTKSTVKAHVLFQMICGQHVGKPSLYHVDALSCTFTFRWTTVAACQLQSREAVPMPNCRVQHPLTGQTVDFHKLDNGPITVDTFSFRICEPLPGNYLQAPCVNKWVCNNGIGYETTPKLYYEDNIFELWFTTKRQCDQSPQAKETFIINFQCDESIKGSGKPIFEYDSTSCHHVYTWSTPIVCIKDQSRVIIDPFPKPRSSGSSAGKKAGIAFAVIAVLLVVAAAVFVLHNRRRRQSLVLFVRENVRKVRNKNTNGSNAVYKYQKITVEDEDDVDLLLGFSDDEEDHETNNGGDDDGDERQTEREDEEMITL